MRRARQVTAKLPREASTVSIWTDKSVRGFLEFASCDIPIACLPPLSSNQIWIGLRDRDILAFDRLLRAYFSVRIYCLSDNGASLNLMSFSGLVRALKSHYLIFRPDRGNGVESGLRLSLYRDKSSVFDSRDRSNIFAKQLYKSTIGDRFEGTGLLDFEREINLPHQSQVQFPIDVVYTWVNHEDPNWRKMLGKYQDRGTFCADTMGFSRFFNRDEIRYSMRSLMLYMPWVNHIHIVSNCAPPSWLNLANKRLSWIDHRDVIPETYLPTFNSRCIETFLHKVSNLSEHFVYMNDDVFVNKYQEPTSFFLSNGIGFSNLEPYGSVLGEASEQDPDFINGARNAAKLMADRFGVTTTQRHKHAPAALRRSVLEEIEREFASVFAVNRGNRFRSRDDASITSFLYHHYAYQTGRAIFVDHPTELLHSSSKRWDSKLKMLVESSDIRYFCLNDELTSEQNLAWNRQVKEFLESRFAAPCELEATSEIVP